MYLFIYEDGTIEQSDTFTDGDKQSVADGYLDVVESLSTQSEYQEYDPVTDEWEIVKKVVR